MKHWLYGVLGLLALTLVYPLSANAAGEGKSFVDYKTRSAEEFVGELRSCERGSDCFLRTSFEEYMAVLREHGLNAHSANDLQMLLDDGTVSVMACDWEKGEVSLSYVAPNGAIEGGHIRGCYDGELVLVLEKTAVLSLYCGNPIVDLRDRPPAPPPPKPVAGCLCPSIEMKSVEYVHRHRGNGFIPYADAGVTYVYGKR